MRRVGRSSRGQPGLFAAAAFVPLKAFTRLLKMGRKTYYTKGGAPVRNPRAYYSTIARNRAGAGSRSSGSASRSSSYSDASHTSYSDTFYSSGRSSSSTGLYTASGTEVRNAEAYASTGAPTFSWSGSYVYSPTAYSEAVQRNSASAAVHAKVDANPAPAYTYSLNLEDGRKYVGMTTDPEKRIEDHFSGAGSQVTREVPPISVNSLNANRSVQSAKRAEALVYSAMRDYHGADMVRGAGHTARFSLQ